MDFQLAGQTAKTTIWKVISKKHADVLGKIHWYFNWRQYVFEPESETIFNASCLAELATVLKELNTLQRHREK
mgnify:FL=1